MADADDAAQALRWRGIDCVMVPVPDPAVASAAYASAFGLTEVWRVESAVALSIPGGDAELVLHSMRLPPDISAHYLVDDARAMPPEPFTRDGDPFPVAIGWCAVLRDPWGNAVCLIDVSSGRRVVDPD